jgi:hypothetical protein
MSLPESDQGVDRALLLGGSRFRDLLGGRKALQNGQ